MSKKIIILNGSPRRGRNTSALTAEFANEGEEDHFARAGYAQIRTAK